MASQSPKVKEAIALLRQDPTITRYQAAKQFGITPAALYNSRECKALMAERNKEKQ